MRLRRYNRVGVVVMILLDPADVPLHSAKLCKYMNMEAAADVFFIMFGVTFVRVPSVTPASAAFR